MMLLFLSFALASPAVQTRPPLELTQGEQRIIRVKGLVKYSLGTPGLVRATVPPNRDHEAILIKGLKPGSTDLWVWKSDGESEVRTLLVRPPPRLGQAPDWQRALARLEEVEVYLTANTAVLQGTVQTVQEARRIARAKMAFPSQVSDQTEMDPDLATRLEEELSRWLSKSRYAEKLRLESVAGRHRITGHLELAQHRAAVEKAVRSIYPLVDLQLDTLPDDSPTLYFKVQLLEIKKSRLQSLGVSWPESVSTSFVTSLSGIQSLLQLDLALHAMELEGSLRVLSRPEIAVRTPGEAELFAGGELPMRVRGPHNSEMIQWKKFGLTLQLKTSARAGPRVRLEITTEVSHLDESIAIGEVPGLSTNRMKTQVDAEIERPLMLSGLLQEGVRSQAKGLPALRKIPILGALFGSEDFMNNRTELVAILIPYDHPPAPTPMSEFTPPAPVNTAEPPPRLRAARPFGLVLR